MIKCRFLKEEVNELLEAMRNMRYYEDYIDENFAVEMELVIAVSFGEYAKIVKGAEYSFGSANKIKEYLIELSSGGKAIAVLMNGRGENEDLFKLVDIQKV